MQLLEAMKKRRSVREFNAEVPSKEEIQAILEAAYLAPALFTTKDAHISVITDKDLLRELDAAAVKKFGKMLENMGMKTKTTLYGAPVLILLSGKLATELPKECEGAKLENLHRGIYWAMGSVMQNMQLRATSLELASCPINTVVVTLFDEPVLAARAGIPEGYSPLCSLAIGKSDAKCEERKPSCDHYGVSYI